jgi:hypothetical protein
MSQAHFTGVLACVSLLLPVKGLARAVNFFFNFFDFEQLVGSCIFLYLHSRVNSHVSLLQSITEIALVVNSDETATFCMFQADYITTVNLEVGYCGIFYLSIVNYHPFFKILADISFVPFE